MTASKVLPAHHAHCDQLFAAAELAASKGRWVDCRHAFDAFSREMAAHFAIEETVLFPSFEEKFGGADGPTRTMCLEHAQMNTLIAAAGQAAAKSSANAFFGSVETLLILMQQHNMKEENILYPMCDRALAGHELDLASALARQVGER